MPKYKVTIEVKARNAREARALVEGGSPGERNPDSGSTFEITTFLIRKAGARLVQMGLMGDWNNPSVYQLPDGRKVYLVGNDWRFEGSSGNGFRSLKARFDEEVSARSVQEDQARQALKEKASAKDESGAATFLNNVETIRNGMERAGSLSRFDMQEDSASIRVRFNANTWVEYNKRTHGFSAVAVGKTVAGWKGLRARLEKYGEYE